MDIASRLACRLGRRAWIGPRIASLGVLTWLAVPVVMVMLGAVIGGLLQPAPEPILMAPLRWYLRV